jgi:phospholipase C
MNQKFLCRIGWGSLICAVLGLCACNSVGGSPAHNNSATPTIIFSANKNTITSRDSVTLNWNATNSTTVTITASTGSGSAVRTVITSPLAAGTQTDKPTQTTTYTAVATGSGGSSSPQTAVVQVVQPAAQPQITLFTASPTTVNGGQTTTISWTTINATSVTITPPVAQTDDTGSLPTSGSSIVPVISTTKFTINATGPGGTAVPQTTTVTVPFRLTLSASPSTVVAGTPVTLSWQITGGTATTLSIDNGVCGSCTPLSQGSVTVSPATTTTYNATATAADGGAITASATVTVNTGNSGVIKHIFFMLQENRSFDMYFGQLGGYRTTRLGALGIQDNQRVDSFNPNVTLTNSNTGATITPFHERTECTENLSPAWDESHHDAALNGGDGQWSSQTTFTDSDFGMNNFLDTTWSVPHQFDHNGARALGYYNSTDLPYYYDLATFFATSDSWHSPVLANTVPNRMYLMAGTSFGHEYPDLDSNHPKYVAPTIFRAMNTANVSWLYYYHDGIFLANFADFQDPDIKPKTFPDTDLLARLGGNCSGKKCDPNLAIPQVVFIDSPSGGSGLDEHPDNNIQSGAAYVQSIIAALMNSDAWQDSVFILSYDEGGGLYDHVPPFMVPVPDSIAPGACPDKNNGSAGYCTVGKLGGTFDLTGFRVPLIVISPFAKPYFVSHTRRDYTAILAFIETTFNVKNLTNRDLYWQNTPADMSEFFDLTTSPSLHPPVSTGQTDWTKVLATQTTSGLCDQTQESIP